jgi:glutamate-ammonia-ligase adenylyltransferase
MEEAVPMAVVAMGKWGGRELNYASDLDVLFVHRVPDGVEAADAAAAGQGIAEGFLAAIGRVTPEGVAFRVDADLRPEGRAGPLARSLEAYRAYYDRWAQTWEFQTLVKARFVAGDAAVAGEFLDLVRERVYRPSFPDAAAREIRTMKARIEQERIPADEDPGFHMKLGHGSLADVEFTTQLLQLTHGGADAGLRATGTREALAALHAAGHLDADEMGRLVEAYDLCSRIRNRLFLQAGRPRDSLPTDPDAATRLAVSLGYEVHPRSELREAYRRVTRRARRVVEGRFYGAGDRPARGREPQRG